MTFTNSVYDKLKWIAQYLLPALGAFYFALAKAWNLPYTNEIVGTLTALDTAIGILLGISSANYIPAADASIVMDPEEGAYKIVLSDGAADILSHNGSLKLEAIKKETANVETK